MDFQSCQCKICQEPLIPKFVLEEIARLGLMQFDFPSLVRGLTSTSETTDPMKEFRSMGADREFVEDFNITGRNLKPMKKKAKLLNQQHCVFCKNNHPNLPQMYNSHRIRDEYGNCTCPVLSSYECPICKLKAGHTLTYCPVYKQLNQKLFFEVINAESYKPAPIKRKTISPIGEPLTTFQD